MTILTIGHSTHEPEQFIKIMRSAKLTGIVDVRSHRTSHWEWWYESEADTWLRGAGFNYYSMPSLGGWDKRHTEAYGDWAAHRGVNLHAYDRGFFPKNRIGVDRPGGEDGSWTNQGLYDYSWYTAIDEFQGGLDTLIERYAGWNQPRIAIMCAESLWWKCHRSMIADVLAFRGVRALHVMPNKLGVWIAEHDAMPRLGRYPTEVKQAWIQHVMLVADPPATLV